MQQGYIMVTFVVFLLLTLIWSTKSWPNVVMRLAFALLTAWALYILVK